MQNASWIVVAILVSTFGPMDRAAAGSPGKDAKSSKPNIVFILADDLGYGDVGCYGAKKVKTPQMDKLAGQGLRFTDGHATSATCTPSRYAILTGEYPWRKKGTSVLPGSASLIVEPGRVTLPGMLRLAGYRTAVVGKWHLGLGSGKVDWNNEIKPGPREIGFDDSFILPATGDRTPCVYVANGKVVGLDPKDPIAVSYGVPVGNDPTGKNHPELLKLKPSQGHDQTIVNGISRIGYMSGGKAARWVDEDMADTLTRQATKFIDDNKSRPFFLYFAAHDIHVPRTPHARFAGKSDCGIRGDAIEQFDWCVGEILAALERNGLADDTIVIVSSDNGPVVDDGYQDGAVRNLNGHRPAGLLRGGKYSQFEGATRVPFLVRWPGRVRPGVSDALVCQIDLLSSFAALTDSKLPPEAAPDSINILPALLGDAKVGRTNLVQQSNVLSLREGTWRLISPGQKKGIGQLFDLANDLSETNNLAAEQPDRVRAMMAALEKIRSAGRTRAVE